VFHFSIWGVGALFGGAKPTKAPPWRRDCFPPWLKPLAAELIYNLNFQSNFLLGYTKNACNCNTHDATPKGDITMCFWSSRYHLCMGSHYWIKDSSRRNCLVNSPY